jgi:hypothetical protein
MPLSLRLHACDVAFEGTIKHKSSGRKTGGKVLSNVYLVGVMLMAA